MFVTAKGQLGPATTALGLELFPAHAADVIRREVTDATTTVTSQAFVRIVRHAAKAKR